jgi:hypothetical protein
VADQYVWGRDRESRQQFLEVIDYLGVGSVDQRTRRRCPPPVVAEDSRALGNFRRHGIPEFERRCKTVFENDSAITLTLQDGFELGSADVNQVPHLSLRS